MRSRSRRHHRQEQWSSYRSGRTGDWLKIKCVQSESFLIIGYEHGSGFGGIGRLLLAARNGGGLVYVGGVGTGFTAASATKLRKQMDKIAVAAAPVDTGKKRTNVTWVRPELVAEIEFRAWTDDGKLRHAWFKGMRDASDVGSVFEI